MTTFRKWSTFFATIIYGNPEKLTEKINLDIQCFSIFWNENKRAIGLNATDRTPKEAQTGFFMSTICRTKQYEK